MNVSTKDAMGKMFFTMMSAFAELEANLLSERTKKGLEAVRARGRKGGRPSLPDHKKREIKFLYDGPSTLNWTTSLKRSIVKIKKVGGLFMRRERREYSNEFKQQMVDLYLNEKPRSEIIREYDLTPSALDRWINQAKTSGSFEHKDNLTKEQKKMMELEKENKQLKMENDILKQAALIIGRK